MVGAPGAGKGTQAQIIAGRLDLAHISSGDLFRAAHEAGTELGREAQLYMSRGALVPDEITVRMIDERLSWPEAADGAVLDGFPRTRSQAEALDRLLESRGARVDAALFVEVSEPELWDRISGRRVCPLSQEHVYHITKQPPRRDGLCDVDGAALYQRDDDRLETVQARLAQQLPPMYEVADHYTGRGLLTTVNGEQLIERVTEDLLRAIVQPAA